MFANLFVLLYVGHLLADYPLQTDHQAACKASGGWSGWAPNLVHAATHVATCGVLLAAGAVGLGFDVTALGAVVALVWIGATHSLIDRRWPVAWWMTRTGQSDYLSRGGAQNVDQAAHVTALALAAGALTL